MTIFQPGDIVLFEAPSSSLLSRTIAALTNSSVSHAAIYIDKGTIIEMGSSGIMENKIAAVTEGQTTYIMRLQDEPDGAPVVKAANSYLKEKIDYDYPSLLLICGLIIYREMKPNAKWQTASKILLRKACVLLDKLLNRMMKKSKHAMMCSQLAYQSYLDAGKKYHIHLKDAQLDFASDAVSFKLLDVLDEAAESDFAGPTTNILEEEDMAIDLMLQELVESQGEFSLSENDQFLPNTGAIPPKKLRRTNDDKLPKEIAAQNAPLDSSLIYYGQEFLRKMSEYLDKTGVDIPLESLFVTPGDLFSHTSNLQQVAEVKIRRLPNT